MDYSMAESSDDEPDLTPEQRVRKRVEMLTFKSGAKFVVELGSFWYVFSTG